jgi:uncharacterized protein (TIGR02172 family)
MEYPSVNIQDWTQVGEGGNGATYINNDEPGILLKVTNSHVMDGSEQSVAKEFNTSRAVFELGVPTPEMKEMVKVGENYGIKCQSIAGKKSISRLCADDPAALDCWARKMASLAKELHATKATGNEWIPSMKEVMLEAANTTTMLGRKPKERLITFVQGLPDGETLLHGDFQMGNLIVADSKPYWIDLGRATHGIPQFDLGHMYLFCNIFSRTKRVQEIAHLTDKQMIQFWNSFALAYNGPDKLDEFTAECKRFAGLDIVLLGMVQSLSASERFFLGQLAKKMMK